MPAVLSLPPIPTLPVARAQAFALLTGPESSLAEVAILVEGDPALTVALLRAANSASSAPATRVSRVGDAIVRLGIDDTRGLVMALLLLDVAGAALRRSGIDLDAAWSYLIAGAHLAQAIATETTGVPGTAFTAAIVRDVGRLVLGSAQPRRVARVVHLVRDGMPDLDAERQIFGADHAAFGAGVAERWGLSAPIVETILHHHSGGGTLADAVRDGAALATSLGYGDGLHLPVEPQPVQHAAIGRLGGPGHLARRIAWFRGASGI